MVEVLLKHGAIKDIQDKWGFSPIMYAVYFGHGTLVKYLVNRGASIACRAAESRMTAYDLSQVEHRARREEREALGPFLLQTQENLVPQMLADGWDATYGTIVHFSKKRPKYRYCSMTVDLGGEQMTVRHRTGPFGLEWAENVFALEDITCKVLMGEDPRQAELVCINGEGESPSMRIELVPPRQLDAEWIVKFFELRVREIEQSRREAEARRQRLAEEAALKSQRRFFRFGSRKKTSA